MKRDDSQKTALPSNFWGQRREEAMFAARGPRGERQQSTSGKAFGGQHFQDGPAAECALCGAVTRLLKSAAETLQAPALSLPS